MRNESTVTIFIRCHTNLNDPLRHLIFFIKLLTYEFIKSYPLYLHNINTAKKRKKNCHFHEQNEILQAIIYINLVTVASCISFSSILIMKDNGLSMQTNSKSDFSKATWCTCLGYLQRKNL